MVNGNIVKSIVSFALPCIWIRVAQNLFPLLDSFIAGKLLNLDSLSAVGLAGSLYSVFIDTFIGLLSGFAIIAGKKCGAGEKETLTSVFRHSLLAACVLGLAVSVLGITFLEPMISLLNTPANLVAYTKQYLTVLFIGLIPNILYHFTGEMLRAVGNSRTPLHLLLISFAVHLVLLYPLTKGFGIAGTAWATVLSYAIAAIIGALYIHKKEKAFRFSFHRFQMEAGVLKECFSIGLPMALTSLVVMLGVLILGFVTNRIGSDYVAAYSAASRVGYIMTTPIFGFAAALAVFVTQNLGAGQLDRIRLGVRKIMVLVLIGNVCIAAAVFLTAKPLLQYILEGSATAVRAGCLYLAIRCLSMFILTPAAIYKSVLPALGRPFFSTLSGFLEIGVRFVFPLLFSQALGFAAVPLTDTLTWLMLALLLGGAYAYEFRQIQKDMIPQNVHSQK